MSPLPEPCPMCGSLVTVVGSREGTQHYEPLLIPRAVLLFDDEGAAKALARAMVGLDIRKGDPDEYLEECAAIIIEELRGA